MSIAPALTDSFGRRVDYLRVSVTERCDLRCAYCRPKGQAAPPRPDALGADDVVLIADAATRLGVSRVRLTGGEPLLRSDLETIICRLRVLPGLTDLSLTTNGQALASRAEGLRRAGLMRVNISLDSLDAGVYSAITGGGDVDAVLRGIDAALAAGLSPVKINVVLASATALDGADLAGFVRLVRHRPVHVRFIEAMPTCSDAGFLPGQQVLERLAQMGALVQVPGPDGGGPAQYYQLNGSQSTIGLIAPVSHPFCGSCNRLRVTARGDLLPCLFSPSRVSLLPALLGADPIGDLLALLQEAARAKPCRWSDIAEPSGIAGMHVIGG